MAKSELAEQAGWLLALGLLFILFGFAVMMFPVAGTFAVELLLGMLLLIAGVAQVALSFQVRTWGGFLFTLIAGLLYALVGLLLLFNPLAGAVTLTLMLGAFMLVAGVLKLGLSFQLRGEPHQGWLAFNGLITLLLGLLILLAWPSDALWVIGLLFGIDMLFAGITFLMLYLSVKK